MFEKLISKFIKPAPGIDTDALIEENEELYATIDAMQHAYYLLHNDLFKRVSKLSVYLTAALAMQEEQGGTLTIPDDVIEKIYLGDFDIKEEVNKGKNSTTLTLVEVSPEA